ncbi:hypothetical protein LCGC14_2521890 [marine sediment metagenome]|uniref:Uncharacterized protein n=1 Tax=marine sediment metagenome TaxID=412755 RepID=A0A0F9D7R3_9ZZZZ
MDYRGMVLRLFRAEVAEGLSRVIEREDEAYLKALSETASVIPWEAQERHDGWQLALEDSATSITG